MSVIPMSTTKGARPLQVKTGSLMVEKIPPTRITAPTIVTGTKRNRLFQLSLGMSLSFEFRTGEDKSDPRGSGKAMALVNNSQRPTPLANRRIAAGGKLSQRFSTKKAGLEEGNAQISLVLRELTGQLCRLLGGCLTSIMLTNIGGNAGLRRVTRLQQRN